MTKSGYQNRIGIVFPHDWTKGMPIGGSSRVIKNLLPYVKGTIYLLGVNIGDKSAEKPYKTDNHIHTIPLFDVSYPSKIPLRFKALLGYWRSKKRIDMMGLDVLYVHSPEAAIPFLLGKKIAPVVYHQHGSFNPVENTDFNWARNELFKIVFSLMWRFIYHQAQAIIAIDKICYNQSVTKGGDGKTYLVTNPVDTNKFKRDSGLASKTRERYGFNSNDEIILFAGRLSRKKCVHVAIDAINMGRLNGKKWSLVIVGEGPLKEPLQHQVIDLGISDHVLFAGRIPYNEMPSFYNMADLVVLPSIDEGVPMMLMESLACGTPVVATRVGGVPEIIRHGYNGILISEATAENVSAGIEKCFQSTWSSSQIIKSIESWTGFRVAQRIQNTLVETINAFKNKGEKI